MVTSPQELLHKDKQHGACIVTHAIPQTRSEHQWRRVRYMTVAPMSVRMPRKPGVKPGTSHPVLNLFS